VGFGDNIPEVREGAPLNQPNNRRNKQFINIMCGYDCLTLHVFLTIKSGRCSISLRSGFWLSLIPLSYERFVNNYWKIPET